jgi:hypothetical protein
MPVTLDGAKFGTLGVSALGNVVTDGNIVMTTAASIYSTSNITLSSGNVNFTGSIIQGTGAISSQTGFKNRIINGAMLIDQRNSGASVTPTNAAYSVDRWKCLLTQASKYTVQQNAGSVTPPAGFTKYLGATSSSAYSVGTGDYFVLYQIIEGLNVSDLAWGSASAVPVALSFWVRSSLTGTLGGSVTATGGSNYSYPFTFTVSSANTWEYKTILVPANTYNTINTDTNGGVQVVFNLGTGTTYSGTANTWQSGYFLAPTGATSVVGTNGATFYITGVQLEVGSGATAFEFRSIGQELALCQRYYEVGSYGWAGYVNQSFPPGSWVSFKVTKRASPTMATSNFVTLGVSDGYNTSSYTNVNGFLPRINWNTNSIGGGYGDWSAASEL